MKPLQLILTILRDPAMKPSSPSPASLSPSGSLTNNPKPNSLLSIQIANHDTNTGQLVAATGATKGDHPIS